MTNQEIIANAPKDWTHYADGTYLQFAGVWLRYESGCPEITSCKEWVADIDIEDCENIRSRADIERIIEIGNYKRVQSKRNKLLQVATQLAAGMNAFAHPEREPIDYKDVALYAVWQAEELIEIVDKECGE